MNTFFYCKKGYVCYAIRFHMDFSEKGSGKNAGKAFEKYPLAFALNVADMEASYYMDDKMELEIEND